MRSDAVTFHFLNVGCGDCTIIYFPPRIRVSDKAKVQERVMMVDIYHDDEMDGQEDVIKYYKANFADADSRIKPIFRFVCTHPHQDHICGLSELWADNKIAILNFWDIEHSFKPEEFTHRTHEADWKLYCQKRTSKGGPTVIRTDREDTPRQFWNDAEDSIHVLSPSKTLRDFAHYTQDQERKKRNGAEVQIDEMSYFLVVYVNSRKVILPGDGRATPLWQEIYEKCPSEIKEAVVLKAGHHGHECAFHEDAVKLIDPSLVVISNSAEEDKKNGAGKLYLKAVPRSKVLKTCDSGTITIEVPFELSNPAVYSGEPSV